MIDFFMGMATALRGAVAYGRGMQLLNGMFITIQLSMGAILVGLVLGSIIVAFKMSRFKILNFISFVYLGAVRGTPAVTQIMLIAAIFFAGFRGNRVWIGILALGINSGAYVAEIIRAGIMSIDKGQTEAGLSLGLNKVQTMSFVVMPQAVKNILPTFVNEFIVLIKETAIVGFVAIQDLTRVAQQILARTADFTPLLVAAAMYLILISSLTFLLGLLEKRLRASDRAQR
ncbi:MAG: amino acid ABC transporter permease [Defluviitaleaceae bacterium]|nr:amino acid ABC transporter permease [Defluviitaleaceae bacterium]MCL2262001.1 amino acid ABC transporter permease [Defluviitaleaceae bacterium]